MNNKHTQGEWKITESSEFATTIGNENDDVIISVWGDEHIDVMEGNAKIVVNAPKLLDELTDIVWLVEKGALYEEIIERVQHSKELLNKIQS